MARPAPQADPAFALRLRGGAADTPTLMAAGADVELANSPWTVVRPPAPPGAALLASPKIAARAAALAAAGAAVVRLERLTQRSCSFAPLGGGPVERWASATTRAAASLRDVAGALRDVAPPRQDETVPAEALFAGANLLRVKQTLLDLGRRDFEVGSLGGREAVRVTSPPLGLLLRAREDPALGATPYGSTGVEGVWVEWPWRSPVAAVLAPVVRGTPMVALGDRAGQWSFAEARLGSLHGPIAPRYEPRGHDFAAAEGSTRFRVKVSLRPSAPGAFAPPAELWLIDEAALERLIRIFEDRPKEEAERLRVARLAGPGGRLTYLVRESRTPGLSPIGPLVSEVTGQRGYAPAAAGVNLYVPVGFELFPPTRRDALNEVFDLGRHGPVLLPEAGGVVNTPKVQDAALSEWITYEAPPRRAELERIDEAPVFDWPELRVEAPPAPREEGRPRAAAPPPFLRQQPRAAPDLPREIQRAPAAPSKSVQAATQEALALEGALAVPGAADAPAWRRLGDLRSLLKAPEDAAAAYEMELFLAPSAEAAARLATALGDPSPAQAADLLRAADLPSGRAAAAAAVAAREALAGRPRPELQQLALAAVSQPEFPVSRRLAWSTALAVCRATSDRLGLIRARERILGGVNKSGMSDAFDMPRFVRFSMAAGSSREAAAANAEQIQLLDRVWEAARPHARPDAPTSTGAFLRAVFAVGYDRLGGTAQAADLRRGIPADGPPWASSGVNRALFALYQRRGAFAASGAQSTPASEQAWTQEVVKVLLPFGEDHNSVDRVKWLVTTSDWLKVPEWRFVPAPAERAQWRPALDEIAASPPDEVAGALERYVGHADAYDYEVREFIRAGFAAVLGSGRPGAIAAALRVVLARLTGAAGPGRPKPMTASHRIAALADCVRVANVLDDERTLDGIVAEASALVRPPADGRTAAPQPRTLVEIARPIVDVARRSRSFAGRLGRFYEAFGSADDAASAGKVREAWRVRAARIELARVVEDPSATQRMTGAVAAVAAPPGGSDDRDARREEARTLCQVMRLWPAPSRLRWCAELVGSIESFDDAFIAAKQGLYYTNKIVVAEAAVDAIVDDKTFRLDQIALWLGESEQPFRRRVLEDERGFDAR